jgi:hypothetical protein
MVTPEITGDLHSRIQAGLLRIDAGHHSPTRAKRLSVAECLEAAFDLHASELSRAGWQLTDTLFVEFIPARVFQWALKRGWLDMTRRVSRRALSDDDLLRSVRRLLRGRIIYWQAEVLSPQAKPESPQDRLLRVQGHFSEKAIVAACGVARSTYRKWLKSPESVLPVTDGRIVSGLRKLAQRIPSE